MIGMHLKLWYAEKVYSNNCVCSDATIYLLMALFMNRSLEAEETFLAKIRLQTK